MRDYVQDQWAPLAHIPELGQNVRPVGAPTWIDDYDTRRLLAYRVLSAYREDTRRYWLPDTMWTGYVRRRGEDFVIGDPQAANYREYGDAGLLVDTARALLLGDDQTIGYPDGGPDAVRTWLDDWFVKERVTQKLLEGEENSIGDADGVYVLGWSRAKARPRLRVFDPGFYFPDTEIVVEGWEDDEFPPDRAPRVGVGGPRRQDVDPPPDLADGTPDRARVGAVGRDPDVDVLVPGRRLRRL